MPSPQGESEPTSTRVDRNDPGHWRNFSTWEKVGLACVAGSSALIAGGVIGYHIIIRL